MANQKPIVEVEDAEFEDLEELDVDDSEEEETDEDEKPDNTPQGVRPVDLAKDLGINPKSLRAYLRRAFPRASKEKNTSWYLTDAQVEAATKNFTVTDDDESEGDEE
jgi:hypothetical protein